MGKRYNDSADRKDLQEIAEGLPQPLADLLVELKPLVTEGQEMVLAMIGPGSRLVLEALGLVEVGAGGLTEAGEQVCELLADRDADDEKVDRVIDASSRFRPITSVSAHRDLGSMAAATGQDTDTLDRPGSASARYDIEMDRPGEPRRETSDAVVYAVRRGESLLVWQVHTDSSAVVVESSSGARLPVGGSNPVVLPNPDDEPPSTLIRKHLAVEPGDD